MARTPRASVPKTSGSGVSRLSYQKGYSMGNRGTSSTGSVKDAPSVASSAAEAAGSPRSRKAGTGSGDAEFNIAFNDIQPVENLDDVKNYAKGAPARDRYAKGAKPSALKPSSKELPAGWKR